VPQVGATDQPAGTPSGRPDIGRTLISARSYDEYVAMFALTEGDLSGSVLDCPGGASSFTAEAAVRGAAAVAVDPAYAADPRWLAQHAVDEARRGNRHTARSPGSYRWTFFADIDDHRRQRLASAERFGADLRTCPSRYVAAALPRLPFADASVDLVLSSHLLFMYADRLSLELHVAAAAEMARVARREVRIFPLISDAGTPTDDLVDAVRHGVAAAGFASAVRPAPYEFARGGNQMLVITRPPVAPAP
jgi:hypothetical protein